MEEAPILTICSCQSQIGCQLESLKRVFLTGTAQTHMCQNGRRSCPYHLQLSKSGWLSTLKPKVFLRGIVLTQLQSDQSIQGNVSCKALVKLKQCIPLLQAVRSSHGLLSYLSHSQSEVDVQDSFFRSYHLFSKPTVYRQTLFALLLCVKAWCEQPTLAGRCMTLG